MSKQIFTIDVINIYNEESETPMPLCKYYEDEEEAVADAKKYLNDNRDTMDVLEASVYAGETMDDDGNVFGEPFTIWTGTNTSKPASMRARKEMGYINATLDYYAAQSV